MTFGFPAATLSRFESTPPHANRTSIPAMLAIMRRKHNPLSALALRVAVFAALLLQLAAFSTRSPTRSLCSRFRSLAQEYVRFTESIHNLHYKILPIENFLPLSSQCNCTSFCIYLTMDQVDKTSGKLS